MRWRQFREWLRVVYAPTWPVWMLVVAVILLWVLENVLGALAIHIARAVAPRLTDAELYVPDVRALHSNMLPLLAFGWGALRACSFHPAIRKRYGAWLAQTPWRYPDPLPFGPVRLAGQDLVVLGVLIVGWLLPPFADYSVLYLPIAFLGGYSLLLCIELYAFWSIWIDGAFILFTALTIMFLASDVMLSFLFSVLMYYTVREKSRRSLRDFPYTRERREELNLIDYEKQPVTPTLWMIGPEKPAAWQVELSILEALAVSVVGGVTLFLVGYPFRETENFAKFLGFMYALLVMVLIVGRLAIYLQWKAAPLSLIGRIMLKRYIIAGFDKVYAAPLLAVCVGVALPWLALALRT